MGRLNRLKESERIPVEPVGSLLKGWTPGIFVKYTDSPITYSNAMATVDVSNGIGNIAGFLVIGSQNSSPLDYMESMWENKSPEVGDVNFDYVSINPGEIEIDSNGNIKRGGSKLATLSVTPTGFFRFYTFEEDISKYTINQKLYVSQNGKLSYKKDFLDSVWTGFILANKGKDDKGEWLFITAGME